MRRRKIYALLRDPATGKRVLAHRWLAEQALGRSLLAREVVHHKDGNSLNNELGNLIVLPSQRVHAHAEFHGRRARSGMPSLFPEIFQVIPSDSQGTLFEHVLIWQGEEPPLPTRQRRTAVVSTNMPQLFPALMAEPSQQEKTSFGLPSPESFTLRRGASTLRDILAQFHVQATGREQLEPVPRYAASPADLESRVPLQAGPRR